MAIVDKYYAYVRLGMSDKKIATVKYWVTAASAIAYFSAVTQVLKDATAVGQLLLSIEDLSKGSMMGKGVELAGEDDAFTYPAVTEEAYAFDKLGVEAVTPEGEPMTLTIPARNEVNYTVSSDGITVVISGGSATAEILEFVTQFNAAVRAKYGDTVEVEKMLVVS